MKADVRKPEDVAEAFQKFDEKRTEVAIILQSNLLFLEQANIAAAAATTRVPTVYGYRVTDIHFGREDTIRGLLVFARSKPIGEDGIRRLKIQVATTGGFDCVNRTDEDARVRWCDDTAPRRVCQHHRQSRRLVLPYTS